MNNINLIFLILLRCDLIRSFQETWDEDEIEENFLSLNREELVITDVTADTDFKVNQNVKKWSSFSLGPKCYTAGVDKDNSNMLVIVFSSLSHDGISLNSTIKTFDLNENASPETQWYFHKQKGKTQLFLIIYFSKTKEFSWFKIKNYKIEKFWSQKLDQKVTQFKIFKIDNKNFIMVTSNNQKLYYKTDCYQFDTELKNFWFSFSLELSNPIDSSALSYFNGNYFLSITQKQKNRLETFMFIENRFQLLPELHLESMNLTQVISFEIGFNSFLAVNGDSPDIYKFTNYGLKKVELKNSNLEGLNFWLAIPIQNYRDETILLAQKTLNHDTHESFNFDIFTYNGYSFEEHEDVLCNYFGENQNGLKCLGESTGNISNIFDATYINVETHVGLIVPSQDGLSLFFKINTEIRSKQNPVKTKLDQFLKRKAILEQVINPNRLITPVEHNEESSHPRFASKSTDALRNLAKMQEISEEAKKIEHEAQELSLLLNKSENRTKTFQNIIFNAPVTIQSTLHTIQADIESLNGEETNALLRDIVKVNDLQKINGSKTFLNLKTENLNFEIMNEISKNEFILKNQQSIFIDGHVTFVNEVKTHTIKTDFINNKTDINKYWIDVNTNQEEFFLFEHVEVTHSFDTSEINKEMFNFSSNLIKDDNFKINDADVIFFPGNLTVENINGENLEVFLSKLCLNTLKCFIPTLKVLGNITLQKTADTEFLNGVKFPADFVLSEFEDDGQTFINLSGNKTFLQTVRGFEVSASTINNVSINDFITLNSIQNLSKTIFSDLEVTSVLEVNGNIKGKSVEKTLKNLGINETDVIKANVEFSKIEVLGNIIVQNNYGNISFNDILADIILKNEKVANINSTKNFLSSFTVLKNLKVDSMTIGPINLNHIITKHSNENLNISKITGSMDIEKLNVMGLFDEKNIAELNKTLLKTTDNGHVASTLIFENPLLVSVLEIQESLNDLNSDQYLYKSENDKKGIDLGDIEVETLVVAENFFGNILNHNLTGLIKYSLKYEGHQTIEETYILNSSEINHLNVKKINDLSFEEYFPCQNFKEKLLELAQLGKLKVENLTVNGSLNLEQVNGLNFDKCLLEKPWTKLNNNSDQDLIVEGNVFFNNLEIDSLAFQNFESFFSMLIFKEDKKISLKDTIVFEQDPIVNKLLEAKSINDIPIEHVLRKDGEQTVKAKITIVGNVNFTDATFITDSVNDVSMNHLEKSFKIDKKFVKIDEDVVFKRLPYIKNLNVKGFINGQNLNEIKTKFIRSDSNITLSEETIFKEDVKVMKSISTLHHFNNISLDDLFSKIILTTKAQSIFTPIRVTKPAVIFKSITIDEDIKTNYLFNKVFQNLVKDAVYINQGLLQGKYKFENILINKKLTTQFLNDLNMSNVIPLKTDGVITEYFDIKELVSVNDVKVGGKVNAERLDDIFKNTVMNKQNQNILSFVIFSNNVSVQGNLTTTNINDKPLDKIVDLDSDQNLTATYKFGSKVWVEQNIEIEGFINGIDLKRWNQTRLQSIAKTPQILSKDLVVLETIIFNDPFTVGGLINNINLTNFNTVVEDKLNYNHNIGKGIRYDHRNLCTDLTYIYKNIKKQIYKFKYFEKLQELTFPSAVQYSKYLKHNDKHLLLVNGDKCYSHLLEFKGSGFKFLNRLHTGPIEQIEIVVTTENEFYLVSRHGQNQHFKCEIEETTLIWKIDKENRFEIIDAIENQDIIEGALKKGIFYGIKQNIVTEFKITTFNDKIATPIKKWKLLNVKDGFSFMPQGLKLGLAIRTEKEIIYLNKSSEVEEQDVLKLENIIVNDNPSADTEEYLFENYTREDNIYIPCKDDGQVVVVKIGNEITGKNLIAVAKHKDTEVQHKLDLIEIFTDASTGELFDKILTYKPSALISLEFGNGEALLAFLEDKKLLQIYEYKGVEGFKHRSTIKIPGSSMFIMDLPIQPNLNSRKVIGVINKNKITLLEAVMSGHRIEDDLTCADVNYV